MPMMLWEAQVLVAQAELSETRRRFDAWMTRLERTARKRAELRRRIRNLSDSEKVELWGRLQRLLSENVVELAQPIPCKGALGFFNVPPEVEAEIRRRFG